MTEQAQPSIDVQDIAAAIQVIDVASSRGAWQGSELSSIGNLRDKFAAFVEAARAAQAAQAKAEAEKAQEDPSEIEPDVGDVPSV